MGLTEDMAAAIAIIRGPHPDPVWSWRGQRLDPHDLVASLVLAEKHTPGGVDHDQSAHGNWATGGPPEFVHDNPAESGHPEGARWLAENPNGVTAWLRTTMSPKDIIRLPGLRGEHNAIRPDNVERIARSIRERGYDTGAPITIEVQQDGQTYIYEGNHRTRAAVAEGIERVPVEVHYLGGAEMIEGVFGDPPVKRGEKHGDGSHDETDHGNWARGGAAGHDVPLPPKGTGTVLYRSIPVQWGPGMREYRDIRRQIEDSDYAGLGVYWGEEETAAIYGGGDQMILYGVEWPNDAIHWDDPNGTRIPRNVAGRLVSARIIPTSDSGGYVPDDPSEAFEFDIPEDYAVHSHYEPRERGEKWDEADHPREPAGTEIGGQFTEAGGGGTDEPERITIDLRRGFDDPSARGDAMLKDLHALDMSAFGMGHSHKVGAAIATMHVEGKNWLPEGWDEGTVVKIDTLNISERGKPWDTFRVLRDITEAADRNRVTLTLNAHPFSTQWMRAEEVNLADLKRLYRRYGFKQPRKGSPDFLDYDTMVRRPRTAAEKALDDALDLMRGWKFDPDQPRVPAGDPDGGQWTESAASPADVSLPPVPAGKVRMYRGMGSADRVPTPDLMDRNGKPTRGRFFTNSRGWAEQYGRRRAVAYVDVPEDAIAEHLFYRNQTTGYEEYTLPEEMVSGLRVYWRAQQPPGRDERLASLGIVPEDLKYKHYPGRQDHDQDEHGNWADGSGGGGAAQRAVERFGLTNDWRKAGYILADGRMIDMGRDVAMVPHNTWNEPGKVTEHGFVAAHALGEEYVGTQETQEKFIADFMRETGAIRFHGGEAPNWGSRYAVVHLLNDPTPEQLAVIDRVLREHDPALPGTSAATRPVRHKMLVYLPSGSTIEIDTPAELRSTLRGKTVQRSLVASFRSADLLAIMRGAKFDPDQPRDPEGVPTGGQWTETGAGGVDRVPTAEARTPKAVERKQGLYDSMLAPHRAANVPANRRTVTAEQRAEIEAFADKHGSDDLEYGQVWKSDGTSMESQGTEKGVQWEKGALSNASVGAHNHPSGGGPSLQDVLTTQAYRIPETIVVSAEYVYRIGPPKGGWTTLSRGKIIDAYTAARKFAEPFRTGRTGQPLTVRQIEAAASTDQWTVGPGPDHQAHRDAFAEWSHALWGEMSRQTGIQYEREKR